MMLSSRQTSRQLTRQRFGKSDSTKRLSFRWILFATLGVALALLAVCLRTMYSSIQESTGQKSILEERNVLEETKTIEKEKPPTCPAGDRVPSVDDKFLDAMFTRLSTDPAFAHYEPQVIKPKSYNTKETPPWILVLDNFLPTHQETLRHLQSEEIQKGFALSQLSSGKSNANYRRSESYNCANKCLEQDWVSPIVKGMIDVTGLSMKFAEDITFTHYGVTGKYGKHHDYTLEVTNPPMWHNCGPRVLTFLVYLNAVERGGATSFFHLDTAVDPKPGRALVFPDVFPERPFEKDERTAHEALVVEAGEKYIAQTWFHQYDYQANVKSKCCG